MEILLVSITSSSACSKLLTPGIATRLHWFVAALVLLGTLPSLGFAQQPTARPAPDSATFSQMASQMSGMFSQMGPMYEAMSQAMIEGTLKALERPETVDRLAAFTRHYYDALIKQGFSKDEALEIVAGVGIPALRTTR